MPRVVVPVAAGELRAVPAAVVVPEQAAAVVPRVREAEALVAPEPVAQALGARVVRVPVGELPVAAARAPAVAPLAGQVPVAAVRRHPVV